MKRIVLVTLAAVLLLACAGCGPAASSPAPSPSPSPSQAAVKAPDGWNLYESADGNYSFSYPGDWKTVDVTGVEIAVASSAPGDFATNFNVVTQEADPTLFTITADDFESIYKSMFANFTLLEFKKTTVADVDAVLLSYTAGQDTLNVQAVQYFFNKGDKGYVLTFTADQKEFAGAQADLDKIVAGFTVK